MIAPRLTPDRLFGLGVTALALAVVVVLVPVPGRETLAPVVDRGAVRLLALVATVAVVRSLAGAAGRGASTATDGGDEPDPEEWPGASEAADAGDAEGGTTEPGGFGARSRRTNGGLDPADWPGSSEADDGVRGTLGLGGSGRRSGGVRFDWTYDDFEGALAAATAPHQDGRRYGGREQVRETLAALAVDAVSESEGIDRAAAAARVADGRWTDRRRAAVLLGDDVAPLSPRVRLLDWASGRPYGRQVDAAVVAIAERAGVETEVTAP